MLPDLRGGYSCSSQPGTLALPRMHSFVVQLRQMAGSRTWISSGETSDCTKLNCPMGQTYLQKAAPRNQPSMTKAARKYPRAIQAVHQGLAHSANVSYAQKKIASSTNASHLPRSRCGQAQRAGSSFLPSFRGSMNGHAMQKTLPATSRPSTSKPRQWIHGRTPARFIGAACGPVRPSKMIAAARRKRGICRASRACRHLRNWPSNGTHSKSNFASEDRVPDARGNEIRPASGRRGYTPPLAGSLLTTDH